MKIYTKTGDTGQTSLYSGERVPKNDLRVDTYGTVDELNAYIGLIADQKIPQELVLYLRQIQKELFILGSMLASGNISSQKALKIPSLNQDAVTKLESYIDKLEEQLPKMTHFILPGGHTYVSYIHIARCICRRAERLLVGFNIQDSIDNIAIQYLNRLSDFLFVLARYIGKTKQVEEIKWIS